MGSVDAERGSTSLLVLRARLGAIGRLRRPDARLGLRLALPVDEGGRAGSRGLDRCREESGEEMAVLLNEARGETRSIGDGGGDTSSCRIDTIGDGVLLATMGVDLNGNEVSRR